MSKNLQHLIDGHLDVRCNSRDEFIQTAATMIPRPRDASNEMKWADWRRDVAFLAVQLVKVRHAFDEAIASEKWD